MLSNQALQSIVAQSVLHPDDCDLEPILRKGAYDPLRRFNVYRNNTLASLTATLVAVFPVTLQLLGESYFRYVAGTFVRTDPPTEARLARYGSTFADFLARFEDIRAMPFIADTARLEWKIAQALDAPVLPACSPAELQSQENDRLPILHLQPSLRLLLSRWPALRIWAAHQPDGDIATLATIGREPERIVLWRDKEAARFLLLDAARFAFLYTLKKRGDLEAAVTRALVADPQLNVGSTLGALFVDGLVIRIRHTRPETD